jgi:hypothetical protein
MSDFQELASKSIQGGASIQDQVDELIFTCEFKNMALFGPI